ncbi:hypothetical protein [Curtobacterium flaccumfaciens]|uniref:hypothetical protein n=1 Tax=Curtobacterium flaccumfaciens TaxID=2035 RepID=UPI00399167F0
MTTDTTTPSNDQQGGQQTPTPRTQDPQQTGTSAETPPDASDTKRQRPASEEAKRFRTQLRSAEAERDTLAGRLETAHRTMVESIAAKSLAKPEALWKAGTKLEDLLDDDGNVDADKVTEAAANAVEELGLAKRLNGPIVPGQGDTPDRSGMPRETFANAFAPR